MKENENFEPTFIEECRHKNDWPMWKDEIKVEFTCKTWNFWTCNLYTKWCKTSGT